MAELDLAQVVQGITSLFTEDNHFVFWYDEDADFEDNIPAIASQLSQPVVTVMPNNQFEVKIRLTEMQRNGESALVYSPKPEPDLSLNLMADMLRYSKRYAADALTMLKEELGLTQPDARDFLKQYAAFFANKERKQRFAKLNYNDQPLELVLLAALAKAQSPALGAILQEVIQSSLDDDNEVLAQFDKYGALDVFWDFARKAYGFDGDHETLKYLFTAMFLNLAYDQADRGLPAKLEAYKLGRANNAITFIQNTRNVITCREPLQRVATTVWEFINGARLFEGMDMAELALIDAFPQIDRVILKWVTARLLAGDYGAHAGRQTIGELIVNRLGRPYGENYASAYQIQQNALALLTVRPSDKPADLSAAIAGYIGQDYQLDTSYRHFTAACAAVAPELETLTEGIRAKVENAYLNDFLADSVRNWTAVYTAANVPSDRYQRNFYRQYVSVSEERTVVIVSDAFRYEAARELQAQLDARDVMKTQMQYLVTGLPSVTYFGMPALLPNRALSYDGNKTVLADGQLVNSTGLRSDALKAANPASVACQLRDFTGMNSQQRKEFLAGQKVVYLYDNQVDTTGEKAVSEQSVFTATQTAITQLARAVEQLRNVSVVHIIVTADHGFIYRYSALDSANKIVIDDAAWEAAGGIKKEQRYAITARPLEITGVSHQRLGELMGNDDARFVNYPKSYNIFQAPGPSQNYVHGGSSAQEMIVPVLDIRTRTGRSAAEPAKLHDVTSAPRITSRDVYVQLMQDSALSETVTAANYLIYFEDADGNQISGVREFRADSRAEAKERIQRVRLTLKDAKYLNGRKYMLVIRNADTDEMQRTPYTMDMVIGGGFGFDI
ncbi:BREX-1 system phosphatase PglZ type A [Lacticaseibacillus kribbianus]|uniref:BREX-1 system phosphatase PglZ type A n=1 Tax=Lacticaseibacillus kribbianus TaxID=2926292 RepID=UPI001CD3120D|nr:BREX-1 system phosphatase PglZ type A [Lacticaseibacillus kribbianus]